MHTMMRNRFSIFCEIAEERGLKLIVGLITGWMSRRLYIPSAGMMWWCVHEQKKLTALPYDWNMCEWELGMLDEKLEPKPALL